MHEGLRQVAPQLALVHVVLLGVQRGGPAGAAVPLEPVRRRHRLAARVRRERHPAPAQQERSLRQVQRPVVMPEPVHVPVDAELGPHRLDGRGGTRVGQRQRAPDERQQQGGVKPRIARRPLQPPGRVHAVAEARGDRVGQCRPAGRGPVPVRAALPAPCRRRDRSQPGHAGEPGVRPALVVQFPDACVRFPPALLDGVGGDLRRPPVVLAEHVQASRGGEQGKRLTERVELELPAHPVPAPCLSAGKPAQPQRPLAGDGRPARGVRGHQVRPVRLEPLGDEPDRPGQQRVRPMGGDGEPRVALVTDPRVPVVVVPPALQPLGQRRGGRRHHRAARRGQPAQHGVRVPRVGHGDQVTAVRHDLRPGLLRRRPQRVGIGVLLAKVKITELQNECVLLARRQFHRHAELAVDVPCPPGARPAEPQAAAAPGPHVALPGQARHPFAPVPAAQVEHDRDPRRPVDGLDPPQQHRPARIGGHREGFPALDPAVTDPAAAPDQRPGLVVSAPDVPRVGRRDRVPAGAAEQPAERGRAVPARHAQPGDRPVRPDKRAALTVRDKRVLPQHPRRQHVARPSAINSHGVLTSSFPPPHARVGPSSFPRQHARIGPQGSVRRGYADRASAVRPTRPPLRRVRRIRRVRRLRRLRRLRHVGRWRATTCRIFQETSVAIWDMTSLAV